MQVPSMALINLLRGHPHPDLLPVAQIRKASDRALSDLEIAHQGLSYGPDLGYEPLRTQLSSWLTHFYRPPEPIKPSRICISGGASQNLARILQVFSDPGYSKAWMVSPTYFLACRIFQDSGFHDLRAVPEDEEGLDIGYLREALRKFDEKVSEEGNTEPTFKLLRPWAKIYRHLIYAVPTFSNPSSKTMSRQRRQQLVAVARAHDALIITDDVYDQLQWPDRPGTSQFSLEYAGTPRIVDIDRYFEGGTGRNGADGFGNSVSNGTFSKIVGPGCRTGWIEGTDKFAYGLSQGGSTKSGGAPSQFTATIMACLMESGDFQTHISHILQPAYERRYRVMISAIHQYLLPLGVKLPQVDRDIVGGYFIWLLLPPGLHADHVASRAQEEEMLTVAQGSLFGVHGDIKGQGLDGGIRVCFSYESENMLSEGIERLGKVIQRMQQPVVQPICALRIPPN